MPRACSCRTRPDRAGGAPGAGRGADGALRLAALALSHLLAAETGIALPVALTLRKFGLVATVFAIGLALAALPAALNYRCSVAYDLRG